MVSYEDAIDRMTTLCMGKMDEFAKEKQLIAIPNFMQFSRTCIGRNITLLEMTKFLPQIVQD
ncbi:Cytochrome P450 [Penicillium viridicatum]|nr:Cytochrome P450 [Penicillium viridicatum]